MRALASTVVIGCCAALAATAVAESALGAARALNGNIVYAEETIDAPVPPGVLVVSPFGGRPRTLPVVTWAEPGPVWSPDGRRIAFARALDRGQLPDIWIADAGFRRTCRVTFTSGFGEREPSWSPDGRRIAYVREGGIWVLDIARGTSFRISEAGVRDADPSWSPRGDGIAFSRGEFGSRRIYTHHPERRARRPPQLVGRRPAHRLPAHRHRPRGAVAGLRVDDEERRPRSAPARARARTGLGRRARPSQRCRQSSARLTRRAQTSHLLRHCEGLSMDRL
jgi:hypothetical protein